MIREERRGGEEGEEEGDKRKEGKLGNVMYMCEEGGGGTVGCGGREVHEVREGVLRLETGEQEGKGGGKDVGMNCVYAL